MDWFTTPTRIGWIFPAQNGCELPALTTMQPTAETPQATQGDMIYVPGFGYLKSEGTGEWSVSENMYENGNKVGLMG